MEERAVHIMEKGRFVSSTENLGGRIERFKRKDLLLKLHLFV